MHQQRLLPAPGVQHDRRLGDASHLRDDVQLAEPVEALVRVGQPVELGYAVLRGIADRLQPMVDEAVALAVHGSRYAATAVVAGDDDLLDLQLLDGELQDREAVRWDKHTAELQSPN